MSIKTEVIKVDVVIDNDEFSKDEYPFIGELKEKTEGNVLVVLFHSYGNGIVLISKGSNYKEGDISSTWIMSEFKKLKAKITIISD